MGRKAHNAVTFNSSTEEVILNRPGVIIKIVVTDPGDKWQVAFYDGLEAGEREDIIILFRDSGAGTFKFNKPFKNGITVKGLGLGFPSSPGNMNIIYK